MTIVYEPKGHECIVSFHYEDNGCGMLPFKHPAFHAKAGTVIACDCGRTFVAQQWRAGEMFPRWRPEGRLARWLRQQRATVAPDRE